jgi:hypothetical protein
MEMNEIQKKLYIEEDPMYIPPEIQPLGMVYSWIRYSVDGCIDYTNLKRMSKMGFRPVLSDRHPDIENDGRVPFMISRGGSIIMERTEHAQEIYNDRINFVTNLVAPPELFSSVHPSKLGSSCLVTNAQKNAAIGAESFSRRIANDRESYIENLSTIPKEKVVN